MNVTDPISDLLTRLRNAMRAGHEKTAVPESRQKVAVMKLLTTNGYLAGYTSVASVEGTRSLEVRLKYDAQGVPVIGGLTRVSRPGRRVYRGATQIAPVLGGMGMSVVSTSRGLMSDREAREKKLGGEILFNVW